MEGHVALGSIQNKQLRPDKAQEGHLVCDLKLWEAGNVSGPLHPVEEQTRGELADVLDADHVVGSMLKLGIASRGVRLSPHELADVGGEVGGVGAGGAEAGVVVTESKSDHWLR